MNTNTIPLSLYVHIPWCQRKCPYCDFNSHVARGPVDQADYVRALLVDLDNDLRLYSEQLADRPLTSIFIGGGTPSLFSAQSIASLLDGVGERMQLADDIEITLEANPGSAEAERFIGFKQAGVTRLSIGAQSFNDTHLQALGRVHNNEEAISAAQFAHAAGLNNFNLDLMFGLPKQSHEHALADLDQALKLNPAHLSCYQLTIEPNTLFHHNPPIRPNDEVLWQMQTSLQTTLKNAGYQQYEVSAYAKAEQQCQHNLNYWRFGDYLGIGAGAHAKVSSQDSGVHRYWKIKHPATYIEHCHSGQDPAGARNKVDQAEYPFEFMLNALRLSAGFDKNMFTERTFLPIALIEPQLSKHQEQGLLECTPTLVQLTERGKTMIDTMLQDYLR